MSHLFSKAKIQCENLTEKNGDRRDIKFIFIYKRKHILIMLFKKKMKKSTDYEKKMTKEYTNCIEDSQLK